MGCGSFYLVPDNVRGYKCLFTENNKQKDIYLDIWQRIRQSSCATNAVMSRLNGQASARRAVHGTAL